MMDVHDSHAVLRAFLGEARERLAAVDRKLDALQSRPGNQVLWSAICRDFHAVTRGAAFFDVTALRELCQSVELLFDELREGQTALSTQLRELIVASMRAVLTIIEDVAHDRPPAAQGTLVAQLREAAAGVPARRS
jgi:two-component system chemotaxis sensor kinase CheA